MSLLVATALLATTCTAAADDTPPPARPPPRVVIIAPPEPEPAPPAPAAPIERTHEPDVAVHRFELSIAATMFPAALDDVRFGGTGISASTKQRTSFNHTGRELGLRHPTFWGAELSLGYRHTYFGVLFSGTLATIGDADARPTNPEAAAQLGTGSVTAYGGGIEAFGTVPVDRLTFSLGVAAGLRGYSAPLAGFDPTVCTRSTRRGSYRYPCAETASTAVTPWVQPRLRFDVALDAARTFFFGGFIGVDALGDRSMLGGVAFGFRFPGRPKD